MSNPVNKNIKIALLYALKNLPPFQIKIRLPTTLAIIVETPHAKAVGPPINILNTPDIIPTGNPIYGPPSNDAIITTKPLALAGTPLTSIVKYEARTARTVHMTICQNMVFRDISPLTRALKLLDLVAMYVKIKTTESILNISINGDNTESPWVDLLK